MPDQQIFKDGLEGRVDAEGTDSCFGGVFIEAGPNEVICGNNDATFREMIPRGYEFSVTSGSREW